MSVFCNLRDVCDNYSEMQKSRRSKIICYKNESGKIVLIDRRYDEKIFKFDDEDEAIVFIRKRFKVGISLPVCLIPNLVAERDRLAGAKNIN